MLNDDWSAVKRDGAPNIRTCMATMAIKHPSVIRSVSPKKTSEKMRKGVQN